MLHVIQTIDSLDSSKGGPSRTVLELSRSLSQGQGVKVSLVSSEGIVGGLRRARLANPSLKALVHDNGLWLRSNLMSAVGCHLLRLPRVLTPHGMLEPWAYNHHRARKRVAMALYQRRCIATAAALHATNQQEAANIRNMGFANPIAVVANGVAMPPPKADVSCNGERTALFLSRLHPVKGILELIEAWSIVRPEHWKLRIVGPDENGFKKTVADRIAQHKLCRTVELFGEADDVQKWNHYHQAQLFVLPSHSENFGLVIGEALACGIPVITTTATPWTRITTQDCGWVIPPKVPALSEALRAATSLSPDRLAAKGRNGRDWIPREFSWNHIAREMHHFYAWVSNGCAHASAPAFVMLD